MGREVCGLGEGSAGLGRDIRRRLTHSLQDKVSRSCRIRVVPLYTFTYGNTDIGGFQPPKLAIDDWVTLTLGLVLSHHFVIGRNRWRPSNDRNLTYMSIRTVIQAWAETGELDLLQPALVSSSRERWVFGSREVRAALLGPWECIENEVRLSRARAAIDTFIGGGWMSARMPPSKSVRAQIALLEPASDKVWEFRSRDPKPGVRIFGHFAEKDHFVALTVAFREQLDTEEDWRREIERCKRQWRTFFSSYKPMSGADVHEYATNLLSV